MTTKSEGRLTEMLQGMIMERQRLLIREANYLRWLVGLPPVRAEAEFSAAQSVAQAVEVPRADADAQTRG